MTEPVPHEPITLEEIEQARARIEGVALRTPLVRLAIDVPNTEIYLKLEVLQPIGSFKIRGAGSLIGSLSDEELAQRRVDRERREHGAGGRLVRAPARASRAPS